jgi:nitrite reductase/ring-hydroxylating ferredoxin subunit
VAAFARRWFPFLATAMVEGPSADRFPRYPATWYRLGGASDIARKPISRDLCGRRLVLFRKTSGEPVALDARCSHFGADLSYGQVIGDSIRCPFHGWEYAADGACSRIPSTDCIPPFARQARYPIEERHGSLFVFLGRQPLFPLPFFFGEQPDNFVAAEPVCFIADCPWYMIVGNGFDNEHFSCVHDRKLIGAARVDQPHRFARRMNYRAEVTGYSIFDRLLRHFVGNVVDVTITSWAGPYFLVTGTFRRARSYILIATEPLPDGATRIEAIALAPKGRSAFFRNLVQPPMLRVRRWFTRGFMNDDIQKLHGVRYNPLSMIDGDRELAECFQWLVDLPQTPPMPQRNGESYALFTQPTEDHA